MSERASPPHGYLASSEFKFMQRSKPPFGGEVLQWAESPRLFKQQSPLPLWQQCFEMSEMLPQTATRGQQCSAVFFPLFSLLWHLFNCLSVWIHVDTHMHTWSRTTEHTRTDTSLGNIYMPVYRCLHTFYILGEILVHRFHVCIHQCVAPEPGMTLHFLSDHKTTLRMWPWRDFTRSWPLYSPTSYITALHHTFHHNYTSAGFLFKLDCSWILPLISQGGNQTKPHSGVQQMCGVTLTFKISPKVSEPQACCWEDETKDGR